MALARHPRLASDMAPFFRMSFTVALARQLLSEAETFHFLTKAFADAHGDSYSEARGEDAFVQSFVERVLSPETSPSNTAGISMRGSLVEEAMRLSQSVGSEGVLSEGERLQRRISVLLSFALCLREVTLPSPPSFCLRLLEAEIEDLVSLKKPESCIFEKGTFVDDLQEALHSAAVLLLARRVAADGSLSAETDSACASALCRILPRIAANPQVRFLAEAKRAELQRLTQRLFRRALQIAANPTDGCSVGDLRSLLHCLGRHPEAAVSAATADSSASLECLRVLEKGSAAWRRRLRASPLLEVVSTLDALIEASSRMHRVASRVFRSPGGVCVEAEGSSASGGASECQLRVLPPREKAAARELLSQLASQVLKTRKENAAPWLTSLLRLLRICSAVECTDTAGVLKPLFRQLHERMPNKSGGLSATTAASSAFASARLFCAFSRELGGGEAESVVESLIAEASAFLAKPEDHCFDSARAAPIQGSALFLRNALRLCAAFCLWNACLRVEAKGASDDGPDRRRKIVARSLLVSLCFARQRVEALLQDRSPVELDGVLGNAHLLRVFAAELKTNLGFKQDEVVDASTPTEAVLGEEGELLKKLCASAVSSSERVFHPRKEKLYAEIAESLRPLADDLVNGKAPLEVGLIEHPFVLPVALPEAKVAFEVSGETLDANSSHSNFQRRV